MASPGQTKYERALELHLRLVRIELLNLKARVCVEDVEKVDEVISALDFRFVGPWNIADFEKRFNERHPMFAERAHELRQEIELDCPPGDPRPNDLIEEVIKDTGLPSRESSGILSGHALWDYSDIAPEIWQKATPTIIQRIRELYRRGERSASVHPGEN